MPIQLETQSALRVAIYIRVSTKLQEDKYSLSAQTHELTKYAQVQGWEIVDIFQDVDSGTKIHKDGLEALLDAVEEGKVDIVLCIEQDRLSRLDTSKWEYLKSVLRDNQVKIAEPGHITDLSNADDEFFSDLKNLLAQRSRKDILRKMMRGKRQFTREGRVWGKQPEEYIYNVETKELTINESRAWIIPFIDELYLDYGLGIKEIERRLNAISKTADGKEWTTTQIRAKLKRKSYHGVLEKEFSTGEIISVPDIYPKLRTEETYNRIQQQMKERFNRKPAEPHFLRGVAIRCASCGCVIAVKKQYVYGKKEGQRYPLFLLMHTQERTGKKCSSNPYINDKRVYKPVVQAVKDMLTDEKQASKYIESNFEKDELQRLRDAIKPLKKRQKEVQEEIDLLLPLYLKKKFSEDVLDKEQERLEKELTEIEHELKIREQKLVLLQNNQVNYDVISEFLRAAQNFEELEDVIEQQRIIGSLFPTATLDAENNKLILHALLPQQAILDVSVPIETTEEMEERELMERSKIRYDIAQQYLMAHPYTTFEKLCREIGANFATLKQDQERFGPLKFLGANKQSPDVRKEQIEKIKAVLKENPKAPGRLIEEITKINRKRVYQLIKEEGLKR